MDTSSDTSASRTVVVVGAGPTGLWLACEFALAGVHTVLLEQRAERAPHARALGIMPRTLEVLALRGVVAPFLAAGRPVPAWHFGLLEQSIRFDVLQTEFPYMLLLPQTTTQELLEERARGLGVEIVTGARVTDVDQDASSATVTYQHGARVRRIEAAFVVGCDGAHSTVRTLSGIPFDGEPSTAWGFVGDVVLDEPPAPGTRIVRPDGALVVAPLPDGRHRLTGWDPEHQAPDEVLDLGTLRTFTRRMAGTDFGARDASWLSRFGDANRLAASYRRGRVLLAGDAAHVHWPTGGLGLNAGIQDAMGLGWRAAAVLRRSADDGLLDDYAAERRAFGETLRTSTLAQGALITASEPSAVALRGTMNRLLATPQGNATVAAQVAGIEPETTLPPVRVGGDRDVDRSAVRDLLAGGKPVFLAADADAHAGLQAMLGDARGAVVVERVAFAAPDDDVASPRAVLVRPDGQIAWTAADPDDLWSGFDGALRAIGLPRTRA
jgi:2-polyprenyl-6-methoxyphenol hydroxylase-like FAD-dependent oxidoreductase